MKLYTKPALAGNAEGLPKISGLPLFDWLARTPTFPTDTSLPAGLSTGGRLIYRRCRRPVETCNALAAVWGIGQEHDHVW